MTAVTRTSRCRWSASAGRSSARYVYLLRSDLERILLDRAAQAGVEIRFGASIRSFDDAGDHLAVTFDDGQTARAELLIGADGVHLRVRELAFGPESFFSRLPWLLRRRFPRAAFSPDRTIGRPPRGA